MGGGRQKGKEVKILRIDLPRGKAVGAPRGPRSQSRTTDADIDCTFVEYALFFVVPIIEAAWAPCLRPPEETFKISPANFD